MKLLLSLCILLFVLSPFINGFSGVDISQKSTVADFECMKNKGFDFAIIRGWCSTGEVDPNLIDSINNAHQAGIEYVDTYLFPCFKCGDGASQAQKFVNYLKGYDAKYGMIWIDVEGYGVYWSKSQEENQQFFESIITGLKSEGVHIGVYASKNSWSSIMGESYAGGSEFSLWYPLWDNSQSFNDWTPYGGWEKPSIKQYADSGSGCGVGYDLNWYPN